MTSFFRQRPEPQGNFTLLVIVLTTLVFILSALTTTRILRRVTVAEVPDLVGKSVEVARSAVRVQRLGLAIAEFRFDQRIASNLIISQDPPPGNTVRSGRDIRVIVSRGSQSIKLPNLAGLSFRESGLLLDRQSLYPGKVSRIFSPDVTKDVVMDQWPSTGEFTYQGSKISLLVSAGPRPVHWVMPALRGLRLEDAVQILKNIGIDAADINRRVDDRQASNTILEQKPAAGDLVDSNGQAALVVSRLTTDAKPSNRYVTIAYHVPHSDVQLRIKLVVQDDGGRHVVYNAMERPDSDLKLPTTVQGDKATLTIFINGTQAEERPL